MESSPGCLTSTACFSEVTNLSDCPREEHPRYVHALKCGCDLWVPPIGLFGFHTRQCGLIVQRCVVREARRGDDSVITQHLNLCTATAIRKHKANRTLETSGTSAHHRLRGCTRASRAGRPPLQRFQSCVLWHLAALTAALAGMHLTARSC